jgi:hypothetical protein
VGSFADGVTFNAASNTNTIADMQFHIHERPYNINEWFSWVSNGQFAFNNDRLNDGTYDMPEVTITPTDLLNVSDCTTVRNMVNSKLASGAFAVTNYQHDVYFGPTGWSCGAGRASVGSASSSSLYVVMEDATKINILIHELG